jgi:Glu-tRNA(Gln) amidotransferase subunit E-like FAD-binding protein
MNELAIRGVLALVIGLCGFGAGKVYSDHSNEDGRRKQNAENERLRKQLKSVLATFAAENKKMEEAIANIVNCPPANINELAVRLRLRGLSDAQIDRIISRIVETGLYGNGAV